jgi:hypothetical protein
VAVGLAVGEGVNDGVKDGLALGVAVPVNVAVATAKALVVVSFGLWEAVTIAVLASARGGSLSTSDDRGAPVERLVSGEALASVTVLAKASSDRLIGGV